MSAVDRRTALRGAGIAGIAGLIGMATTAKAATTDAELIRACDKMIALQREFSALFDQRHTVEDEKRTEPELLNLYAREDALEKRFYALPAPTTIEGVRALARMALRSWELDFIGEPVVADFDEWSKITVLDYLAGDAIGA